MMKMDSEVFFRELKRDVFAYANSKVELLKLGLYERIGKVISALSYSLVLLVLTFFLTLFLFIALAFLLGDWLHSPAAGFAIVAVLYLLIIGGVFLYREKFQALVLNTVIAALTTNDYAKNEATGEEDADPAGTAPGA